MALSNPLIRFLVTRRSIRRFRSEDVSDDLLVEIVDTARWAPSSKNRQPWEFIIVKNRETLKKLSKCYPYAGPLSEASAAIAVIGDPKISPKTYLLDCANATMCILLAAHALGLGAVWINSLENEEMVKLLNIPKDKTLVSIVAIGWPAEDPKPKPRKNIVEITYYESYGNPLPKNLIP